MNMETDNILHSKDGNPQGVHSGSEVSHSQTPELNPAVWPDPAQYELFVAEVNSWADEAMVALMGEYPQFYDQLEGYFDIAKQKTLSNAQHGGKKSKEYFMKRVEFELFQPLDKLKKEAAATPAIAKESLSGEAHDGEALSLEDAPVLPLQSALGDTTEEAVGTVEPSAKFNRLLKYQNIMKQAKGMTIAKTLSQNGAPKDDEVKLPRAINDLSALGDLLRQEPGTLYSDAAPEETVQVEMPHAAPAHHDAPEAIEAVLSPEDEFSVSRTLVGGNIPSAGPEASVEPLESQSLEGRVKRSIMNGSFDLSLATGPQLEALLIHPDTEIQARAKKVIEYRAAGHPLSLEFPYIEQWIGKSETERGQMIAKFRDDFPIGKKFNVKNGETGAIEKWKLVDVEENGAVRLSADGRDSRRAYLTVNVLELLELNPEQVNSGAGIQREAKKTTEESIQDIPLSPETVDAPPAVDVEKAITPSADSSGVITAPLGMTVETLEISPVIESVSNIGVTAELSRDEEVVATPRASSPVVPQPETIPETDAADTVATLDSAIDAVGDSVVEDFNVSQNEDENHSPYDEKWSTLPDEKKRVIVAECRERFVPNQVLHVRRDGSEVVEDWELVRVKDDGKAFMRSGSMFNNAPLLELMELNPETSVRDGQEGQSAESERDSQQRVNKLSLGREAEFAAAKERFAQMTGAEQAEYVGECEFDFLVDSVYEITNLDNTVDVVTLRAISTTGMVLLENADGEIDQIPIMEFRALSKEIGRAEGREETSREEFSTYGRHIRRDVWHQ